MFCVCCLIRFMNYVVQLVLALFFVFVVWVWGFVFTLCMALCWFFWVVGVVHVGCVLGFHWLIVLGCFC
jgi:hypothetical protein